MNRTQGKDKIGTILHNSEKLSKQNYRQWQQFIKDIFEKTKKVSNVVVTGTLQTVVAKLHLHQFEISKTEAEKVEHVYFIIQHYKSNLITAILISN